MAILKQPAAQARLALDLQVFAEELSREHVGQILQTGPRVVFLDLGKDPSGVSGIQVLGQEAPEVALIVAGPPLSAEGLLAVMRAGASEYLPRPFSQEETLEAFLRVRRRAKSVSPEASLTLGTVTTVFSAKGGTGVTTVATNLAIALRILTGKEVLLLDLAPALGTAAVAMGVQPRYSYLDVVRNFHRIDEELFRSFLETHDSGVQLLASPLTHTGMEAPAGDDLHGLLNLCKQHFDHVVIDGGSSISDSLAPLLQESDERVLIVTPELPTLRNLKHALDLFGHTNGRGPPRVVLNQYKDGIGLSSGDVEDGLGHRLAAILEKDDVRVLQSINLGRPEVMAGRSRLAKALMDLGSSIAGPDGVAVSKKGFLDRFLKSSKRSDRTGNESR